MNPPTTARLRHRFVAAVALLAAFLADEGRADDGGAVSFDKQVRPILISRCVDCHSGTKPAGGLDLTSRAGLLHGSKSGRVVEPNDPDASLLFEHVAEGTMPPKKADRLGPRQVERIKAWISAGVPWEGGPLVPGSVTTDRRAGLDWWSLQPIRRPPVPAEPGARGAIDAFVSQKLRETGLPQAPPADRRTLIRRMTFDLHGLPPTPEEIDAFLTDDRPDAVERLVDRLLASPRYGERWARHWLDVVRFAESHGYEHDNPRPNAWAYRDYVVNSLNADKPYDRFVIEQLAGDVSAPGDPSAAAATGFLVAGPYDEVGSKVASALMRANVRQDELEDLIGVAGQTFLGLTLQCARCHDHKFDPVTQNDFYRLEAVFAGVKHGGAEMDKPPAYVPKKQPPEEIRILGRGDVQAPGAVVGPGFPDALGTDETDAPAKGGEGARRLAFARRLVDRRNPLTARVVVNRVWQRHFGRGIVATPSDFGFNGARPTHPELLDLLAAELIDGGWRLKPLHRLILLSAAYRRSSRFDPACASVDAESETLWRFPPRRLDAEEVRDAMLAVSGDLNPTMGGKGFDLFDFKTNAGTLYRIVDRDGRPYQRRSIYRTVVRGAEAPLLSALDCPDASTTTPARSVTITPLQALSLWNDRFVLRRANDFARRLGSAASTTEGRIDLAYRAAYGRSPTAAEVDRAVAFAAKRGLAEFCRVLFNTGEFLTID